MKTFGRILAAVVLLGGLPAAAQARTYTCFGREATIVGTPGRDNLIGSNGDDVIVGLGAWDHINGGRGDDLICGGGNRRVQGYGERLLGGSGSDRISGGGGPDDIDAGSGRDLVRGLADVDYIRGGPDNDLVSGGPGADFFGIEPDNEVYRGGRGSDTLAYNGNRNVALQVDLPAHRIKGAGADRIYEVENVFAIADPTKSGAGDTLIGDGANNFLSGGAGDDSVKGAGGNDCLGVSAGDDELVGGSGFDYATGWWACVFRSRDLFVPDWYPNITFEGITVDLEHDVATGDDLGTNRLISIEGAYGSFGNDTLIGDEAMNRLFGLEGQDELRGGPGDDYLHGGDGTDTGDGGDGADDCPHVEAAMGCE